VDVLLVLVGFFLLVKGADLFVDSAVVVARRAGVSQYVIGVSLVAFATSLPEMAVSSIASLTGVGGIAVGNVIGSNVANVCLAIGLPLFFYPILPGSRTRFDTLLLLSATGALWLFLYTGRVLGRVEGGVFFVSYILFLVLVYRRKDVDRSEELEGEGPGGGKGSSERSERPSPERESARVDKGESGKNGKKSGKKKPVAFYVALTLFFGLVVVFGADLLVRGAIGVSYAFGVSDLFIGSTVVALGTSLPEITTSVVAGIKKKHGITVGNVIGSNLMNILAVLGFASLLRPIPVPWSVVYIFVPYALVVSAFPLLTPAREPMRRYFAPVLIAGYVFFVYLLVVF